MIRLRRSHAVALTTTTVILGLGLGSAAYAFWSSIGTGTGTGVTGATVPLSLSAGTPTSALYPGGQATVVAIVTNTNESPIHIGSLALDTSQGTAGFSVDASHSGCSTASLSFATQTNGGAGWTVPARIGAFDGTLPLSMTGALGLSASAADACQGAVFTVYLAAA